MSKIFPTRMNEYHDWLSQSSKNVLKFKEEIKNANRTVLDKNDDLTMFTEIPGLPKNVVIFQIGDQIEYSLLPRNVITKLINAEQVVHLPIVTASSFKILDTVGDDVTTLYLPIATHQKVSNYSYDISTKFNLSYLRGVIENYEIWTKQRHYAETIVDQDEVMLFRAITPFQICDFQEDRLLLQLPGFPDLQIEFLDFSETSHLVRITYDFPASQIIEGDLIKIEFVPIPFLHFKFTMNLCEIGNQSFEDVEVPSYALFQHKVINSAEMFEIGKQWSLERISEIVMKKATS